MNELYPSIPILIVDDEEEYLKSIKTLLKINDIDNVMTINDPRKIFSLLEQNKFTAIFLDLSMPYLNGFEVLKKINALKSATPIIVVTADNKIEMAVECIKAGAYDYVTKPFDETKIITVIKHCLELNELKDENTLLKKRIEKNENIIHYDIFTELNSNSFTMKSIFKYAETIAKTELPVLITGETGTGKEILAKIIHRISARKGNFVACNISGEEKGMIGDVLFGHVKGGFTGADSSRKGIIEKASSGTLFLDEIGDLSEDIQIKLLRFLQDKKYYPVGSDEEKFSNTRLVFATNKNLTELLNHEKLRSDLFYRLIPHHITLPPLRERREDMPLLFNFLMDKASKELNKEKPFYPKELFNLLNNYNFPGNIRELEGMIFDALTRHEKGILSLKTFSDKIFTGDTKKTLLQNTDKNKGDEQFLTLKKMEELHIKKALTKAFGNQNIASKLLGISRRALNNRLSRNSNNIN